MLKADSNVYTDKSDAYETFSQAEDPAKKIVNFMLPKVDGKIVLDFGCGTGKFIPDLSLNTKKYFGTDINETQLRIAREKCLHLKNVEIIKTEQSKLQIPDKSIEVIFSSWVIGSIQDLKIRYEVLEEFKRILKPGGSIYLLENDIGGEYKELTGGEKANKRTEVKLEWLKTQGYSEEIKINTEIAFKSNGEARHIFEQVWNRATADKIKGNSIQVNLVIYSLSMNSSN